MELIPKSAITLAKEGRDIELANASFWREEGEIPAAVIKLREYAARTAYPLAIISHGLAHHFNQLRGKLDEPFSATKEL